MTYEIVFTNRAVKELEKLDQKIKNRIIDNLKTNRTDPLGNAIKLTNSKIGTYRYKIGDYRVVFDLDDKTIVIL